MAAVLRNRFYSTIAVALALLVAFGFTRTFYARPLFDLPPLPSMLQLHGALFTAWFLLFVVQTRLIATYRIRAHKTLGIVGVGLAVLVVILGVFTAFQSSLAMRPRPMGMTSPQFVLVPLIGIAQFALLVGCAVAFRRRASLHKRFMVLAMIGVLGPPVARLVTLAGVGDYWLWIQTTVPALLVIWCLVNDWRKNHIVHPIYSIGGALLVISWPLRVVLAHTDAWAAVSAKIVALMS
jgi:hypothetical protein